MFFKKVKLFSLTDTRHEALLQCLAELTPLAKWAFDLPNKTKKNDMTEFVQWFFKEVLKKG